MPRMSKSVSWPIIGAALSTHKISISSTSMLAAFWCALKNFISLSDSDKIFSISDADKIFSQSDADRIFSLSDADKI